jgi:hypothetical protein
MIQQASASPSSTKLILDILAIRLRDLDVCAGLVQVYNAKNFRDKVMVCHALNESKIISLGDAFANVTISALPTFHVASPVTDSSTKDRNDLFKYYQLIVFEGLTDQQTHTMIFDAFFASCNVHDPVRFRYLSHGRKTTSAISLEGLSPIRTGPTLFYTAMAFTSSIETASPHPNRVVPHYLELYGIKEVCKALT